MFPIPHPDIYRTMIIDGDGIVHESDLKDNFFDRSTEPNGRPMVDMLGKKLADRALITVKRVLHTGDQEFFALRFKDKDLLILVMVFVLDGDLKLVLALRARDENSLVQRSMMKEHSRELCKIHREQKLREKSGKTCYDGISY